jgi:hypothetical protein
MDSRNFFFIFPAKTVEINNFYIYGRLLLAALNWRGVAISNRQPLRGDIDVPSRPLFLE